MFYSQTILTKKGKLGIIWLAATYDGSRRFLSSRDFKKVNIIKACNQIMHPQLPFALRLSSTLLVGVVRVYREQTKIILVEAKDMMKAVRAAISKQSSVDLQMSPSELRQDAVTLPLLLDYDMDFPECQEQVFSEHIIAFSKSNKYFRLSTALSPLLSLPSTTSTPEHKLSSGGGTVEERSPFQAELKDITLPEIDFTKISPEIIETQQGNTRRHRVPGEIDIDGGPLPSDREMYDEPDESRVKKRTRDLSRELGEKRRDGERDEKRDPLRRSPSQFVIEEGDKVEEAHVMLFSEESGVFQPTTVEAPATPTTQAAEIAPRFATPDVRIEDLEPIPPLPPRKRKLAIDFNIRLTGDVMRKNCRMVDKLKKKKIIDLPRITPARELFSMPASQVVGAPHFLELWQENAVTRRLESSEISWTVEVPLGVPVSPVFEHELELPREEREKEDEDAMSGIEILRAGPGEISSEFERSTGIDMTPDLPLESSRRDLSLSGERIRVDAGLTSMLRGRRVSSLARTVVLSPIADEELDVDMLSLEEIEERPTLLSEEEAELESTKSDEAALQTLRSIRLAMAGAPFVSFDEVVPLTTNKKMAAKAFYHVMAMTHAGILHLEQNKPYGEIIIGQGRAF